MSRCCSQPGDWHQFVGQVARSGKRLGLVIITLLGGWVFSGSLPNSQAEANHAGHAGTPGAMSRDSRMARVHELIAHGRDRCVSIDEESGGTPEQRALVDTVRQTRASDLGAWLIDQASALGVLVCLDAETDLEAYYRAHLHIIGLNTKLSLDERLVYLAHELAHVPQHPRFSNNRRFAAVDMILLHRVREATAEAVATRVLWQLREQGLGTAWQAKLETAYGDIAQVFRASMGGERGRSAERRATRLAFLHWFEAAWRTHIYDDLMMKTLARIVSDHIGLPPASRWLTDSFLRDVSNYDGAPFLVKGDGKKLMSAFEADWSMSGKQAWLDVILGRSQPSLLVVDQEKPPHEGAGLSASSSGPIRETSRTDFVH